LTKRPYGPALCTFSLDDFKWLLPSSGIAAGLFVTDPNSSFGMASYHPNTKIAKNYIPQGSTQQIRELLRDPAFSPQT